MYSIVPHSDPDAFSNNRLSLSCCDLPSCFQDKSEARRVAAEGVAESLIAVVTNFAKVHPSELHRCMLSRAYGGNSRNSWRMRLKGSLIPES
jgi:hypothetical protein